MRRHGPRGFLRGVAVRAGGLVWLTEEHVWYELPLAAAAVAAVLEPPLRIARARREEIDDVERIGRSRFDARAWHAAGHDLWLVRDGDAVAFSCWIFRGRVHAVAHPDRWLPLAPGVACLEDSVTAPDHRGRGIAPRAWSHIAATLRAEGLTALITRVETENAPSRRAVEKAGFQAVAVQRLVRRGRRERVAVEVLRAPRGEELRAALERGGRPAT